MGVAVATTQLEAGYEDTHGGARSEPNASDRADPPTVDRQDEEEDDPQERHDAARNRERACAEEIRELHGGEPERRGTRRGRGRRRHGRRLHGPRAGDLAERRHSFRRLRRAQEDAVLSGRVRKVKRSRPVVAPAVRACVAGEILDLAKCVDDAVFERSGARALELLQGGIQVPGCEQVEHVPAKARLGRHWFRGCVAERSSSDLHERRPQPGVARSRRNRRREIADRELRLLRAELAGPLPRELEQLDRPFQLIGTGEHSDARQRALQLACRDLLPDLRARRRQLRDIAPKLLELGLESLEAAPQIGELAVDDARHSVLYQQSCDTYTSTVPPGATACGDW
jgi:hypothetical protein